MARADRIDAREEQRKKELEKEKQRQVNKRKRDEKAERDRVVKRKMLEEGRITIEDTWGKVTASQPRLNKFFRQPPALAPDEAIPEEGTSHPNSQASEGRSKEIQGNEDQRGAFCGTTKETTHCNEVMLAASSLSCKQHLAQALPSSLPSLLQVSNSTDHGPEAASARRGGRHSLPSTLKELSPSRINARLPGPTPSLQGTHLNCVYDYPQSKFAESNLALSRPRPAPGEGQQNDEGNPFDNSIGPKSSLAGLLESRDYVCTKNQTHDSMPRTNTPKMVEPRCQEPAEDSNPSDLNTDDGEDFTDGIDDETFLMLCATQKPVQHAQLLRGAQLPEISPAPASQKDTIRLLSGKSKHSSFNEQAELGSTKQPVSTETMAPVSMGVTESFSAEFNEIDDEDLIALAEEVEADMATPKVTQLELIPEPAAKPTMKRVTRPTAEPVAAKQASDQTLAPGPMPKRKKGRTLPWEDYGVIGPSTQALMLELVQQAEAEMKKPKRR